MIALAAWPTASSSMIVIVPGNLSLSVVFRKSFFVGYTVPIPKHSEVSVVFVPSSGTALWSIVRSSESFWPTSASTAPAMVSLARTSITKFSAELSQGSIRLLTGNTLKLFVSSVRLIEKSDAPKLINVVGLTSLLRRRGVRRRCR